MRLLANLLILFSVLTLFFTFGPVLKEETKYNFNQALNVKYSLNTEQSGQPATSERPLTPPNKDFSIVIPKIGAVAPVVANVDSQNPDEYLKALRLGVAHAEGTFFPGEGKNTFLFAHSTDAFYNVGRYNAVFYLIGKLKPGDEINIFYRGELLRYEVFEKKVVDADDVQYLGQIGETETLTLQTCYPPGTTLKRLVVVARRSGI